MCKILETPILKNICEQLSWTKFYETEFPCEQKKKISYNLWNKTYHSSFEIIYFTVFAATKPRSEPGFVARLGLPYFAELPFVDFVQWAGSAAFPELQDHCFLSICFGSTSTFFKSLYNTFNKFSFSETTSPRGSALMRLVKWPLRPRAATANSSQLFKLFKLLATFWFWLLFPYLQIYFQINPCSPFLSSY